MRIILEAPVPRKVLTKKLRVVALFHAIFPDAVSRVNIREAIRTVGDLYQ